MEIRRFREEDAQEVSSLVVKTLRTVNIKDYSRESSRLLNRMNIFCVQKGWRYRHLLQRLLFTEKWDMTIKMVSISQMKRDC